MDSLAITKQLCLEFAATNESEIIAVINFKDYNFVTIRC